MTKPRKPKAEATPATATPSKALVAVPGAKAAEGVTLSIITDAKKAAAYVTSAVNVYAKSGRMIHVAFVTAMWHAATHGNPALLNRVYHALRTNDAQAAKLYVRRAHIIIGLEGENPEGQDSLIIQAAADRGAVFALNKGEWSVIPERPAQRAALVKLCEERFIVPDLERDQFFMERNNFAEVQTIGDTQALDAVLKAITNNLETTDKRKIDLSDPIKKLLTGLKDRLTSVKAQVA